jgi:acetyl/propionyl-CoA carboxylase alpha subunit
MGERECSVQRRHQKVIEETPSPFLTPEQRRKMCAAAVELGELLLYEGAGTVEFVVDAKDGSFYFLEVNTRLQVEHPITEETTGLDVVALQVFVAAGGKLSDIPHVRNMRQEGHAIECRLCAEDAANGFMPENGTIQLWKEAKLAQRSRDIRYETAVESGSTISIHFDSMIAKVVVWATTRESAIARMVKVMANTACVGLKTNQLFLQSCLLHPAFHQPTYTTSLIPDNLEELLKNPYTTKIADMSTMLAVIPALLFRDDHLRRNSKPFRNVRKAFKNQASDPANVSITVVQTAGSTE